MKKSLLVISLVMSASAFAQTGGGELLSGTGLLVSYTGWSITSFMDSASEIEKQKYLVALCTKMDQEEMRTLSTQITVLESLMQGRHEDHELTSRVVNLVRKANAQVSAPRPENELSEGNSLFLTLKCFGK